MRNRRVTTLIMKLLLFIIIVEQRNNTNYPKNYFSHSNSNTSIQIDKSVAFFFFFYSPVYPAREPRGARNRLRKDPEQKRGREGRQRPKGPFLLDPAWFDPLRR